MLAVGPGCGSDRTNWVSESESHQRIERHYYGRCLHCCRGKGKCDRAEDQGTRVGYGGQIWAGYLVISVNHTQNVRMSMRGFYRMTGTDEVKHFVIDVKKNYAIIIDEKKVVSEKEMEKQRSQAGVDG